MYLCVCVCVILNLPRSGWVGIEQEGMLVDNSEFSSCGDLSVRKFMCW